MHFYLIRHGQSYINLPDWDGNDLDQVLTPLGQQQVEAVGKWLSENIQAEYLFSSTLKRTRETADAVSRYTGLDIIYDDRIREIGTNGPDGAALSNERLERYMDNLWGSLQPYDAVTRHGENWMQFRSRVGAFIEDKLRTLATPNDSTPETTNNQRVLVVCHGGVIEAFFEYVFAKGPWSVVTVTSNNTSITHLEYRPVPNRPAWRLHYSNRVEHLTPELIS
ncbi:MAG: histidine phosphatase family protein [Anaerolineales bacterium]|nr:histidine phosphatase family protein [Anaerolineales bacterium]